MSTSSVSTPDPVTSVRLLVVEPLGCVDALLEAPAVDLTAEQVAKLDNLTLPAGDYHNEAQMRMLDR
jgi:hypothetical protein